MTEIDKYGRIKNRNFQPQSVSSFPSFNDDNGGIWHRINAFVSNIGDWISENQSNICTNISIGIYFLCWALYAIVVIALWIDEGFFSALFVGIIGGFIVYYGAAIIMFLSLMALSVLASIVRLLFYNIYSLVIGIAVLIYGITTIMNR